MMNKWKYTYSPRGRMWCVYEQTYHKNGSSGTLVAKFTTKEEARDKTYELNGWNKLNKTNKHDNTNCS